MTLLQAIKDLQQKVEVLEKQVQPISDSPKDLEIARLAGILRETFPSEKLRSLKVLRGYFSISLAEAKKYVDDAWPKYESKL